MADRMKLPSEIETPLDRRAMTIDILAAEIERKNRTIKAWRIKYDELESQRWQEKHDELKAQLRKMKRRFAGLKINHEYSWGRVKDLEGRLNKANGKAKDERLR